MSRDFSMHNKATIIPAHLHYMLYLDTNTHHCIAVQAHKDCRENRKMKSKIPPPPPLPKTLKFILPNNIPSETSTDDHALVDHEHDYKTIREVINPLYLRKHKTKKQEEVRPSTGLIYWTQVTSIMSSIFSLLVILCLLTFIMVFRSASSQTVQNEVLEESDAGQSTTVKELPKWTDNEGREVQRFLLSNSAGLSVSVMSWGAAVTSIVLPDGEDVVLGFDSIAEYQGEDNPYFGSTVGRVANRVKNGEFEVEGEKYSLARNNGNNTLHGGVQGFDKQNWLASVEQDSVVFTYLSQDQEEGFPGDLLVSVKYRLTEDSILLISMQAVTTKPTPVNLANHAYYNLGGHGAGPDALYDHKVTINADWVTPVNDQLVPTGEIMEVDGTPFDLRAGVRLGDVILTVPGTEDTDNPGFDHNLVVTRTKQKKMKLVSIVEYQPKGRRMKVFSNQPGVQFYTGNFLPRNGMAGKGGTKYSFHGGFCLETQNFPDFANNPEFPDGILRPGEIYTHNMAVKCDQT